MADKEGLTRRSFLSCALGVSFLITLAGVLTPVFGYVWPPKGGGGSGGGARASGYH